MSARAGWFRRSDHVVLVGAFVGALLLLGLSSFTTLPFSSGPLGGVTPPERIDPFEAAQAGDCLNWDRADLADIGKVECSASHLFEVSGVVDISSEYGPQAPFPDATTWQTINADHCASESLKYLSNKLDPFGKYTVGPLNPGEKRWAAGKRTLRCGLQVAAPSGRLLPAYGSARTQDQSDVHDPGVCLGIQDNSIGDPVSCEEPHTFEIIGVVDLGAGNTRFPTEDEQESLMTERCDAIANEYSGGKVIKERGLLVTWDYRAQESWDAGSKLANCKVGALPNGTLLTAWTGSVHNPDAPPLAPSNPPQTSAVQQAEATGAPMHSEAPASESSAPSSPAPSSSTPPSSKENEEEGG
ncbi:septum formation family protein [Actinosynnema pretiosum subsp. pretiosum]|uniref:Septum formation family protein n=1 Tax=Actinosynnema pretiosum subsp. pretiosum TaxID=103721 RepID=A0AA45L239_9PSEU|nr:septum formation family protein [Actinosynnema pretiosum subsp. pretiosum]